MAILVKTMTSNEAKTHFGEVILAVQTQPIQVTKNGKPAMMMISIAEYEEIQRIKREFLQAQIDQGLADIKGGQTSNSKEVFHRLQTKLKKMA